MARTEVTLKDLKYDVLNITTGDTAINATLVTNGLAVTDFFENVDNSGVILVTNAEDSELDVTIQAGNGVRSGLGAQVVPVAATTQLAIPISDSDRFMQADGGLYVDFETGLTGTIIATGKHRQNYS